VPTYSYACTNCAHRFDAVQSFTDSNLTVCPECSGRLRKLFNSVGIVFKGSGFYRTDSRAGAVPEGAKKEKVDARSSAADGAKSSGSEGTKKSENSTSTSTAASSSGAPSKAS